MRGGKWSKREKERKRHSSLLLNFLPSLFKKKKKFESHKNTTMSVHAFSAQLSLSAIYKQASVFHKSMLFSQQEAT